MLTPIYEPKFSDGSYGYRPHRSAKDAILKVKECIVYYRGQHKNVLLLRIAGMGPGKRLTDRHLPVGT